MEAALGAGGKVGALVGIGAAVGVGVKRGRIPVEIPAGTSVVSKGESGMGVQARNVTHPSTGRIQVSGRAPDTVGQTSIKFEASSIPLIRWLSLVAPDLRDGCLKVPAQ